MPAPPLAPRLSPPNAVPSRVQRASGLVFIQTGLVLYALICLVLGLFSYFAEEYLTSTSRLNPGSARVFFFFSATNFTLIFGAIFLPRIAGGLGVLAFVSWSMWVAVESLRSQHQWNLPDFLTLIAVFGVTAIPALLIGLGVVLHMRKQSPAR